MQQGDIRYCVEHKIDGLKVILTYKKGKFVQGATRGDGKVGENITENLKTIKDIPLVLKKQVDITVVGEAWLPHKELERINEERKKNHEPVFANARNAAAGSLRQLDPKIVSKRNLRMFAYDIDSMHFYDEEITFPRSQHEELHLLNELGFSVNDTYSVCENIDAVIEYYRHWLPKKQDLAYGIDGLAIKVDQIIIQEALGYTAKAPRYAIAYKFPAVQVTTVVEDIVLQVGRTGVLTPVAKLRPVLVDGSVVSRATLHNEDEIKRLDVRVGDTVVIQKAGDVIPDIVRVLFELRTGNEKPYIFPKKVAECGGDGSIERIPGQAAYRCVVRNSAHQQRRILEHAVSKKAFNIDGFGKQLIAQFMDENIISSLDDIFTITKGDIIDLPGFGEKSALNLLSAIESAKTITLPRFLYALSIDHVGEETAYDIAREMKTLENVRSGTKEDFESIEGVGPIVASSITEWFHNPIHAKLVNSLVSHVTVLQYVEEEKGGLFSGKTFVFTGSLQSLSRDDAKERVKKEGGKVSSSVSSKTHYVVVGADPGEKYEEAMRLGVPTLNEEAFLALIGKR